MTLDVARAARGALGRAGALTCASLLAVSAALAQCKPVEGKACVLVLKGKDGARASDSCTGEPWSGHLAFTHPERFTDLNGDGWWESVVEIDLDPAKGCGCAVFRAHFEEDVSEFSVNIGDSRTNDGHGGDRATTRYDAEVQLARHKLDVFSADPPPGAAASPEVLHLLSLDLPSTKGRSVEMEVCNQFFRFAFEGKPGEERPLRGEVNTVRTQQLFAIGPRPGKSAGAAGPDGLIYAAFNRVIHDRRGAPAENRFGSGVARVELFLTP